MTSIFNFTTGHPVLDAWLHCAAGRGADGAAHRPYHLADRQVRPTDFPATEETATTQQRALRRTGASTPPRDIFEHLPIASVESGRSEAENEASPGAHPFVGAHGVTRPTNYWEGHNGLRKRS